MRTDRRRRLPAVLPLAVLAVAACESGPSAERRLETAPDATLDEGTAAFALDTEIRMGGPGAEGDGLRLTVSGEGVRDFATESTRLRMSVPGTGQEMEMLLLSDTVYLRMPSGLGGEGRTWIRQPTTSASGMGAGAQLAGEAVEILAALRRIEGEVRKIGSEEIRGTRADGFSFTVAGSSLWGEDSSVPRAMRDLEVPTEVWIDRQNRVRRVVTEVDLAKAMEAARAAIPDTASDSTAAAHRQQLNQLSSGMLGTVVATLEFYDFGTGVEVRLPEGVEVVDAEEFRRRISGGSPDDGEEDAGEAGEATGGAPTEGARPRPPR